MGVEGHDSLWRVVNHIYIYKGIQLAKAQHNTRERKTVLPLVEARGNWLVCAGMKRSCIVPPSLTASSQASRALDPRTLFFVNTMSVHFPAVNPSLFSHLSHHDLAIAE